jgi:hypothetical protein
MKIFTNKYFTYNAFKIINSHLIKSQEIMKIENNIFIPVVVKNIKKINNIKYIDTYQSCSLPLWAHKFKPRYYYKNEDFFDIVQDEDIILTNIKLDSMYRKIKIVKYIKEGDILLIEDKDRTGVI